MFTVLCLISVPLLMFVCLDALPTRLHLRAYYSSSRTMYTHRLLQGDFPKPLDWALPFCWLNMLV